MQQVPVVLQWLDLECLGVIEPWQIRGSCPTTVRVLGLRKVYYKKYMQGPLSQEK